MNNPHKVLIDFAISDFKSFGDSGPVRVAPITLLYGENSVGKSSLAQVLLAHLPNADSKAKPVRILPPNGAYHSIRRGLNYSSPALEIRSFEQVARFTEEPTWGPKFCLTLSGDQIGSWSTFFDSIKESSYYEKASDGTGVDLAELSYSGRLKGSGKETYIGTIKRITDPDSDEEFRSTHRGGVKPVAPYYGWVTFIESPEFWKALFDYSRPALEKCEELRGNQFFDYTNYKDAVSVENRDGSFLFIEDLLIESDDYDAFRAHYESRIAADIWRTSDTNNGFSVNLRDARIELGSSLAPFQKDSGDSDLDAFISDEFDDDLLNLPSFHELPLAFGNALSGFTVKHLGAYRDKVPDLFRKRLSQSGRHRDTYTFDNHALRKFLAGTMRKLGLGYSVDIQELPGTDYYKVWLVDEKSRQYLHPSDVGFGIGQIVQMLAGLFDQNRRRSRGPAILQVIEEPEAHLHPSLQRKLSKILSYEHLEGVNFLIETHSEALIRGYLEQVRNGQLPSEALSVVYVESSADGSRATTYRIDSDGEFIGGWPQKLFPIEF